jgi:integrase
MAGSIRQRPNGSWQLRVYLGRDEFGRVVHKTKTVYGTRRQALTELNQMVAEFQGRLAERDADAGPTGGRVLSWGPATTINDAIERWKLNGWSDPSPTTQRRYQGMWDL